MGSDVKIMNVRDGEYIGEIEGAHFKGTSNFGLIVNSSMSSKLKAIFNSIGIAIKRQRE